MLRQLAEAQVNVELDTGDMVLNLGPQHPATHGTLRLVVRLDGERVIAADPVIGYMHRGYEKLTEFRTYPQITTLINRIDWLSSFANEVPFIAGAEMLMGIEAPPRALYIRTVLTELSRIATFLLFLGEMGLQVGAITPAFYGFRDREYVLNLIEAVTGGRFHPNFNRIGGLKDDLPWGWISECRATMRKVLESCDEFENLVRRQPDLRAAHALDRDHPGRARRRLRRVGLEPARERRRLGPPARRKSVPRRTTSSTGRSGPTPTVTRSRATGCGSRRRVSRRAMVLQLIEQMPSRPDHGEGAAHHQGARGRGLGQHREPARRDGLLHRVEGRDRTVPRARSVRRRSATCRSCRGCCAACTSPTSSRSSPASTSSSGTSTGDASPRSRSDGGRRSRSRR